VLPRKVEVSIPPSVKSIVLDAIRRLGATPQDWPDGPDQVRKTPRPRALSNNEQKDEPSTAALLRLQHMTPTSVRSLM
jgi:hypothetical protein